MSDLDEKRVDALISIATAALQYPTAMKHIHQWAIDELAQIEKQLGDMHVTKTRPSPQQPQTLFGRAPEKGK